MQDKYYASHALKKELFDKLTKLSIQLFPNVLKCIQLLLPNKLICCPW